MYQLGSLLVLASLVLTPGDADGSPPAENIPLPRPRATNLAACTPTDPPPFVQVTDALGLAALNAVSVDISAIKSAIDLVRRGRPDEATKIARTMRDSAAQKLLEWLILRSEHSNGDFDRYATFVRSNPAWPGLGMLRRRAEGALWQEQRGPATVHLFLAGPPTSTRGRLALARALLSEGDRNGAEREVREVWRSAELSAALEAQTLGAFPNFLNRADDKARMEGRLDAKDFAGAMRAAKRLDPAEVRIVKDCAAEALKSGGTRAQSEAASKQSRPDLGYTLCHLHWLLRNDGVAEAARLMLAAPRDGMQFRDTDEWWRQRRTVARKLLDLGDAGAAYQIVRDAAPPANENYRAETHFLAGWIALRFLDEPAAALAHFAHVDDGSANPILLARASYWRGRAAEATGRVAQARAHYEAAARHPTAYYGQLARAKIGLPEIALHPAPEVDPARRRAIFNLELMRAADILYMIGERRLAASFVADLGERSVDVTVLAALAELAARYDDAQATLRIGKAALARGFALDVYAFPNFGLPRYEPIGPEVDLGTVYSVARTESAFDQRDVSPAKAVGLMQVTPAAGRDTARRFGVAYDWDRLVCDPVYNTQMGAAELAGLLRDYRGANLLVFAGYNAGRGRVDQWIRQYGDPRDSRVDPVDWVERIPFAETRNYVQRVMEGLHVYRSRFRNPPSEQALHRAPVEPFSSGTTSLLIPAAVK
jgi:soluble lytic murein transglycosylase